MQFIKTTEQRIFNINIVSELLIDEIVCRDLFIGYRVVFQYKEQEIELGYFHTLEDALKVFLIGTCESANDFSMIQPTDLLKNIAEDLIPDCDEIGVEEWVKQLEEKENELIDELEFLRTDFEY